MSVHPRVFSSKPKAGGVRWALALLGLIAMPSPARSVRAQQTIINVPSDARTPQGLGFYLHESQISTHGDNSAAYTSTNFLTYGWTKNTELCVTQYQASTDGAPDLSVGFGFKSTWEVFQERLPELHTRYTFGTMIPISLGEQRESAGFFTYSTLAFDVPYSPFRLLAGAAGGSSNVWGRSTASAIMGLECPLTDHLAFTGEWFSGDHNFSGLIPGVTYHRDELIVVAGYKMSNDFDAVKSGFVLEVGFFFGGSRKSRLEKLEAEESPHYGVFSRRRPNPRTGFR